MKTTAELEAMIAELESENVRLREETEWIIYNHIPQKYADKCRARAFPPKFEKVEVKEWNIQPLDGVAADRCVGRYDVKQDWVPEGHVQIEMTGHYHRPIPSKPVNQFKEGMLVAAQHAMNKACLYVGEKDRSVCQEVAHYIKAKAEEL